MTTDRPDPTQSTAEAPRGSAPTGGAAEAPAGQSGGAPRVRYEVPWDADPASLVYTFGGAAPVMTLQPGTVLESGSFDCYGNRLNEPGQLPSEVIDSRYLNPQTGPFEIAGAQPGDTLAVHFHSIEPHADYGVSASIPFFGALTSTPDTATLQDPLPEKSWYYRIDAESGVVHYAAVDSKATTPLPLDPMHGTVGVAPPLGEVRSSLAPGSWGGNMDTPEMRAGVTAYFGVNVPGAMFSFGDGHARQGEGESCGTAVETAMDTVLSVDLVPGAATPWPRLESDEYVMTTGSAKPMEDAFRVAHTEMVRWVAELTGLSVMDAYQFVSQTSETPIAQACDTVYTVVCKVRKEYLDAVAASNGMPSPVAPYGGIHARMREFV
ncbi:acetamidase/formamidase family protein [Brevibacterium samyangense]|uniref:Acetamidase/formamidase family protein n=1 Tax=Brevibacterium samyangense TaxID=366888 RepID=A0ABP5EHT1_9MICO